MTRADQGSRIQALPPALLLAYAALVAVCVLDRAPRRTSGVWAAMGGVQRDLREVDELLHVLAGMGLAKSPVPDKWREPELDADGGRTSAVCLAILQVAQALNLSLPRMVETALLSGVGWA